MPAELKVMSARAVMAPVKACAAVFMQQRDVTFTFDFAPVGTIEEKLAKGEAADAIILSRPAIAKLADAGRVNPASVRALGRMSIGVAVRAGAAMPDISAPETFRELLVAARAISVSDPAIGGTSAVYLPKLFERLGLTAALEPKLLRQRGGGGDVAACVARGEAEIGITFISEMLPVAGVAVAGPLPAIYGNDTVYCAALPANAGGELAGDFIKALIAPESGDAWRAAGFSPPD
jgi:molybdate transport system substrate-binding protein